MLLIFQAASVLISMWTSHIATDLSPRHQRRACIERCDGQIEDAAFRCVDRCFARWVSLRGRRVADRGALPSSSHSVVPLELRREGFMAVVTRSCLTAWRLQGVETTPQ